MASNRKDDIEKSLEEIFEALRLEVDQLRDENERLRNQTQIDSNETTDDAPDEFDPIEQEARSKESPINQFAENIPLPCEITSLNKYVECISSLSSYAKTHDRFYFRGQYSGYARGRSGIEIPSQAWTLRPSLARVQGAVLDKLKKSCGVSTMPDNRSRIIIQSYLVQRLRRLAEHHFQSVAMGTPKDLDFITWLSIAQHHKVPTFLMDWTVNPFVGLYFAIEDAFDDKEPIMDGDIWIFDLVPLEARNYSHRACFFHTDESRIDVPRGFEQRRQRDAEEVTLRVMLSAKIVGKPIVIVPRITAKRIDSQAARFVYWDGPEDLATYTLNNSGIRPWRSLRKLCWIPADCKRKIAQELATYRIHPGTIDADLDGYARFLRWGGL